MRNNRDQARNCCDVGAYRLQLQVGAEGIETIGKAQVEGNTKSQPAGSESRQDRNPRGRIFAHDIPVDVDTTAVGIA